MKGELPEWPSLAAALLELDIPLSELFDGRYDARPQEDRLMERFEKKLKPLENSLNRILIRQGEMAKAMGTQNKSRTPPSR
jgi:hypothetical protein